MSPKKGETKHSLIFVPHPTPALTFSPPGGVNLIWETTGGVAPSVVPASTELHLHLVASITGGATNFLIQTNLGAYTPVYDANAVSFFKYIVNSGATLTAAQSNAVNTLVIAMKADGSWASNDCIYPMVGTNGFSQGANLKDTNHFNITWSGSMTFNASGATGDGSSGYGDTGFAPSVGTPNYTLNSASLSYYSGVVNPTGIYIGVQDFVPNVSRIAQNSSTSITSQGPNDTTSLTLSGLANLKGFGCVTRTASNLKFLYAGGTSISGSTTSTGNIGSSQTFYVFARNVSGPANFSNGTFSYFSLGGAKSPAMEAAEAADVLAFETALGRQ